MTTVSTTTSVAWRHSQLSECLLKGLPLLIGQALDGQVFWPGERPGAPQCLLGRPGLDDRVFRLPRPLDAGHAFSL